MKISFILDYHTPSPHSLQKSVSLKTEAQMNMYLNRLTLLHFKNISEAEIEFSPRINCLVGENGTGKTNVLDAVHYLSMCKSAFGLSDSQSAQHGEDSFMVNGIFTTEDHRQEKIVCSYQRGNTKKIARGGKEYEKLSDHIGLIPNVMVSPSDNDLINESGEERRRYLNSLISQLDREYLNTLIRYNHLLAERNKLLKHPSTPNFDEILEVLDLQMASLGTTIHKKRHALISELAPKVNHYYSLLSGDRERVELSYKSELNQTPFEALLKEHALHDRICMFTSTGIHRDDMNMTIGGYPLRKYGSQGQQKSFLVALKLAQYDLITAHNTHKPILLLDDIFDKLDMNRVGELIQIVSQERFGQIFITDCNKVRLERVLHGQACEYTLFEVSNGAISPAPRNENPTTDQP